MTVLIIDNYDSFVYNLAQYVGELGFEPRVRRNDEITPAEVEEMNPRAILISPGPCTPAEAGLSNELVRRFTGRIPILGVCLGHQCIAAAFGGPVVHSPKPTHGKSTTIHHDGKTIFAGIPNPLSGGRYHSLVVEARGLPDELAVSARTGDGIVMGIRHRRHPVEGIQFHPESILTPCGHDILRNFFNHR
jgi:anthranilate synthase component 2